MEQVFIRISDPLLIFITDTAQENEMTRTQWIRRCLQDAVARPLPKTLVTDDVLLALSPANQRLDFLVEPPLLKKIDKTAHLYGLSRTQFVVLAMLCFLSRSV